MAMGRREQEEQGALWIVAAELPRSGAHVFYDRVNEILDKEGFDAFAEDRCRKFYAKKLGRSRRAGTAAGGIFPIAADRLFRGNRQRARDRMAHGRLAGSAEVPGLRTDGSDAGPFDDQSRRAGIDRSGDALGSIQVGAGSAGEAQTVERQDGGRRCDDAGGPCGAAEHHSPRHGRELSRVPGASGKEVGHPDTDAGRPVPARRDRQRPQEQGLERRLEASVRSGCEDHEEEGWPDAPGPQVRVPAGRETWTRVRWWRSRRAGSRPTGGTRRVPARRETRISWR